MFSSYRNQSVDLQLTGFYMMGTLVVKRLNKVSALDIRVLFTQTSWGFFPQGCRVFNNLFHDFVVNFWQTSFEHSIEGRRVLKQIPPEDVCGCM